MKSLEAIIADNAEAAKSARYQFRPDLAIRQTGVFDFGDGCGPVPVHRHPNGGGLVADTAYVAPTAYVGPRAWVFGRAAVLGKSIICDEGRVGDCAVICDQAQVSGEVAGNVWVVETARVLAGARLNGNFAIKGQQVVGGEV